MRRDHGSTCRVFYNVASSFVRLALEAQYLHVIGHAQTRTIGTASFLLPSNSARLSSKRRAHARRSTNYKLFTCLSPLSTINGKVPGNSDANSVTEESPAMTAFQSRAPMSLEDLLSSEEPRTPETKQLIWRAWLGFSEDHQAARVRLLDSLLDMLQTSDPQDARRLQILLESKDSLIDGSQRIFYSFWANMILLDPELAYKHYVNLPTETQQQYAKLFMQSIVESGVWSIGVQLWNLSHRWSARLFKRLWHKSVTLTSLLHLIPALESWRFLTVLEASEAQVFRQQIRPTVVIHLAKYGKVDEALRSIHDVIKADSQLYDSEVAMTIQAMSKARRHEEALCLYQQILSSPSKPVVVQRLSLAALRATTQSGQLESIKLLLNEGILSTFILQHKDRIRLVEVYTMIMDAFARQGQVKEVEQYFQDFLSLEQKPDAYMLGALLHARVKTLEIQKAKEIFDSCVDKYGVKPDLVLHNMLLTLYADILDVDSAIQTVELIKDARLTPDIVTATTLIDLYAKRKNANRARQTFESMCSLGVVPTVAMYGALAHAFVESEDYAGMRDVMSRMERALIKPDAYIMNIVLKSFVKEGRSFPEMEQLIQNMTELGVYPTASTYTLLMRVQVEEPNLQAALEIFQSVRSPNQYHYTVLMVGYLRQNDDQSFERVQGLYDEMISRGIRPTNVTMAVLINACRLSESPKSRETLRTLLDALMTSNEVDLTTHHIPRNSPMLGLYRLFFRRRQARFDKIVNEVVNSNDLFIQFLRSTVRPDGAVDIRNMTAIMSTYETTGDIDKVRSLFEAAKAEADRLYRYDPSGIVESPSQSQKVAKAARYILTAPLSILMQGLTQINDFDEIENVWRTMREDGYEPDDLNWNQYIRIQLLQGDIERGLYLIKNNLYPTDDDSETRLFQATKEEYLSALDFLRTDGIVTTVNGEEERSVVWERVVKNYAEIINSIV